MRDRIDVYSMHLITWFYDAFATHLIGSTLVILSKRNKATDTRHRRICSIINFY